MLQLLVYTKLLIEIIVRMNKHILTLILSLSIPLWMNGENIDSLKLIVNECLTDSCVSQRYYTIATHYLQRNPDSLFLYCDRSFDFAKQCDNKDLQFKSRLLKVMYYSRNREFEKSDSLYQVLKEMTPVISPKLRMYLTAALANYYFRSEQYDSAKVYYQQSIVNLDTSDTDYYRSKGGLYTNVAVVEMKEWRFKDALIYLKKSEELLDSISNVKPEEKFNIYNTLGNLLKRTKDFESALTYYQKAYRVAYDLPNFKYSSLVNRVQIYAMQKNMDSLEIYINVLTEGKPLMDKTTICLVESLKTRYFILTNNIDSALIHNQLFKDCIEESKMNTHTRTFYINAATINLLEENKGKALSNFRKSLESIEGKKILLPYGHLDILEEIVELSIAIENPKILNDFERYKLIKDSVNNIVIDQEIQKWKIEYETEKKEAQNQFLQNEKELQKAIIGQQKITLYGGALAVLLLILLSSILWKRSKERKETNLLLQDKNEKIELLNQELSHRVKNNLAMVASLLRLQGRRLNSEEAKQAIKEGEMRIEAMSLVHRKLYVGQTEFININEYLTELCERLKQTYPLDQKIITIDLDIEDVMLDAETVVHIGLIVNELVTNSFKYAFENVLQPLIQIELEEREPYKYQLNYQDNGKGMPQEFDLTTTKSLGIKLIHTLTKQLKGSIDIESKNGVCVQIDFEKEKLLTP